MAVWSTPHVFAASELVTPGTMNQYVSDELTVLHGDAGTITYGAGPFYFGGDVFANKGGAGEMSMRSNNALYFSSSGSDYIYMPSAGLVATGGRLQSAGMDVVRHPYGAQRHFEAILGPGSTATSYSVSFTSVFASAPVLTAGDDQNGLHVPNANISTTGFTVLNPGSTGVQGRWMAFGA